MYLNSRSPTNWFLETLEMLYVCVFNKMEGREGVRVHLTSTGGVGGSWYTDNPCGAGKSNLIEWLFGRDANKRFSTFLHVAPAQEDWIFNLQGQFALFVGTLLCSLVCVCIRL